MFFKNTYALSRFKKWCEITGRLICTYPQAFLRAAHHKGMQLLYLKEKHSSCGRCCRGKWENPISDRVHDIGSMSTLTRWHRLLATLEFFLEGIFKRLIEGVKRQQLRSTVFPYLHSKIPNLNLVATEWCTQSDTSSFTLSRGLVHPFWSLKLISCPVTSAGNVWTLRFLLVFLSRTHPHQNSVGD